MQNFQENQGWINDRGQGREGVKGASAPLPFRLLTLHVLVSCLLALRINENVYSNYSLKQSPTAVMYQLPNTQYKNNYYDLQIIYNTLIVAFPSLHTYFNSVYVQHLHHYFLRFYEYKHTNYVFTSVAYEYTMLA